MHKGKNPVAHLPQSLIISVDSCEQALVVVSLGHLGPLLLGRQSRSGAEFGSCLLVQH